MRRLKKAPAEPGRVQGGNASSHGLITEKPTTTAQRGSLIFLKGVAEVIKKGRRDKNDLVRDGPKGQGQTTCGPLAVRG